MLAEPFQWGQGAPWAPQGGTTPGGDPHRCDGRYSTILLSREYARSRKVRTIRSVCIEETDRSVFRGLSHAALLSGELMPQFQDLYDAIVNGDAKKARAATQAAMDAGTAPMELISASMVPAMDEVGRLFEAEEYFVPELLLAGRAMKSAMELLRPLMIAAGQKFSTRVVIGTVKGDLHDIGKNIVASMLEGGGFEVIDLGADVAPEKFVAAVEERQPHVVCMSALLTVTMPAMRTTIDALKRAGLRDRVKVLIGGAPVTTEYAREIGADGYSDNASGAVSLVKSLVTAA